MCQALLKPASFLFFMTARHRVIALGLDAGEREPLGRDVAHEPDEAGRIGVGDTPDRQERRKTRTILALPFDLAAHADDVRNTRARVALQVAVVLFAPG